MLMLIISLAASAAFAQQPAETGATTGARWLPWVGCWRPAEQRAPEEGAHVCVVPAGTVGARMMTLAGDQVIVEETVVPDGTNRDVVERDCRGTRRAEWSRDGERLFSSAELTCDSEPKRTVSGISLITPDAEWIDVQVVTVSGRESVRVRRYRRSADRIPDAAEVSSEVVTRAARAPRGSSLSTDDVIEASGKVSSKALEAALLETKSTFHLDSRSLVAMDDAHVAGSVIDLMVALSYPRHFEVKRSSGGGGSFAPWPGFSNWDWYGFDPLFSYYTYYSPFNYRYYDPFGYYYYGSGGGVLIETPSPGVEQGPHGRVVNGGGYTQIAPRSPDAPANARSSSPGDSSSSSGSSNAGGSSDGGGSVSSGGYSSGGGGGGGDSGHVAVPR